MARLQHSRNRDGADLRTEHLIGRSRRCDTQLQDLRVSSEHAAIRWTGECWVLKDLGSLNGTFVNGASLSPGFATPLKDRARISFGDEAETWTFLDDDAPSIVAVPCAGGDPIIGVDGLLALPSGDRPLATIYSNHKGAWTLDRNDSVEEVNDGAVIEVDGARYQLSAPQPPPTTAQSFGPPLRVGNVRLEFGVSSDEEHIELWLHINGQRRHLGARGHNYLMLHLARLRLDELSSGLAPAITGWLYQDQLCSALAIEPSHLNIDVYRIRRQFAATGIVDPMNVVERRPGTRQLRIGTTQLMVSPI